MDQGSHGSWVKWVVGLVGHGPRGLWVTLVTWVTGYVGHRSRGS